MIELTDLQTDILKLAVETEMNNREIADELGWSEEWVGEVRRRYESRVNEEEIPDEFKTIDNTGGGGSLLVSLMLLPFTLLGCCIKLSLWVIQFSLKASLWVLRIPFGK